MLKRVCFAVFVVSVAALLAGCGSSSKTSSTSTNASAATTTTGATGTTTTGAKVAKGPNAGHFKRAGARVSSPAVKGALSQFAACIRKQGVNLPGPNKAGRGPLFNTKGVNTTSVKFKAAELKCRSALLRAFHVHPGAGKVGTAEATSGSTGHTKAPPAPKLKVKVPPKVAHALEHFTACMREHGIANFPEPEGASFNLSHTHVDPKSAQYKAAEIKCNPILNAAF